MGIFHIWSSASLFNYVGVAGSINSTNYPPTVYMDNNIAIATQLMIWGDFNK